MTESHEEEPVEENEGQRRSSRRSNYAEERISPESMPSRNANLARLACVGAALVGALIWGAIAYYANYEIGWVAWGIGGLVGGACIAVGGRGMQMAVTAAIFSLVSILVGKLLSVQWGLSAGIQSDDVREMYEGHIAHAKEYAAIGETPTDEQVEAFILEYDYGDITAEEFRTQFGNRLAEMAADPPTFEEYGAEMISGINVFEIIADDFHILDLVFAGLGIATAYGLVMKASQADALAVQQARRGED